MRQEAFTILVFVAKTGRYAALTFATDCRPSAVVTKRVDRSSPPTMQGECAPLPARDVCYPRPSGPRFMDKQIRPGRAAGLLGSTRTDGFSMSGTQGSKNS
ncbi:hypothetical protein [Rhizobium ruizarguesonis]|nr:hypothetical protein [Rhizobium ruizarguesonis]